MTERKRDKAAEAQRSAEKRAKRLEAGLCPICPATPRPNRLAEGLAACRPCLDRRAAKKDREADRARHRKRAADKKARGECTDCREPAEPGRTRCAVHAERRRQVERNRGTRARDAAAARERRAARRASGQCTDCPAPARPGRATCAKCAARKAEAQKAPERRIASDRNKHKRRSQGLCVDCARPAYPGSRLCEEHRKMRALKDRLARETRRLRECAPAEAVPGVRKCDNCKRPALEGLTRCEGHRATQAIRGQIETLRRQMGLIHRTAQQIERDKATHRRVWNRRVMRCEAAGRCVRCQKAPATPGATDCQGCRDRWNGVQATREAVRRIEGRCVSCGAERLGECTATLCEPCTTRSRERNAARNAERRAAGLCVRCAEPNPRQGFAMCSGCAAELEALGAKAGILTAPDGAGGPRYHVWAGDGADLGEWECEAEALAAASFGGAEGFTEAVDDDASAFARMVSRDGSPPPER